MAEAMGRGFIVLACAALLAAMSGCAGTTGVSGKADGKPAAASGDAAAMVRAGDAALAGGNAQRALAAYAQAEKAGADEARERICRAHLAGRNYRQALEACRAALEARPDDPEALYGAGYAALMSHDADGATAYFEKTLEVRPDMVQAARMLGLAHHQARRPEKAVEVLTTVRESGGGDADTENNLGLALLALGRSDEAVAAFGRSLAVKDSPRTRNNLGLALCRAQRFEEAYAAFLAAGGEAAAHNNLGVCYRELGMADKAAAEFEAAIARNPRYYPAASENLNRMSDPAPAPQPAEASGTAGKGATPPAAAAKTPKKETPAPSPVAGEKKPASSPDGSRKNVPAPEPADEAEARAMEKSAAG
jgi:tetratricopeptide (TPR) repeat protein